MPSFRTTGGALALTLLLAAPQTGCSAFGGSSRLGRAACPALRGDVNALDFAYSSDFRVNAKVRTFVQAAKDMGRVTAQLEQAVATACIGMARDLRIPPAYVQPRRGEGGAAAGACNAVVNRIDAILRAGVQLRANVTPPVCQANAQAYATCAGRCDVNTDAECRASCQASANVNASCSPARVQVQASVYQGEAGLLAQTMQRHLPTLIQAQIALGQRLAADARTVVQVGSNLPGLIGQASAQALACVGAAADVATSASARLDVSVRASASVSARAGT